MAGHKWTTVEFWRKRWKIKERNPLEALTEKSLSVKVEKSML